MSPGAQTMHEGAEVPDELDELLDPPAAVEVDPAPEEDEDVAPLELPLAPVPPEDPG